MAINKAALQERLAKQISFIESGGRTQRMHTIPTLHNQNVADHSYGVAWWCWLLGGENPSANLLMAALAHDVAEHETGDIPSPTKRTLSIGHSVRDLEEQCMFKAGLPMFVLSEAEERILRIADGLELIQHCIRERALGNRNTKLRQMYANAVEYTSIARENYAPESVEDLAMKILVDTWRRYEDGK